MQGAVWAEYVKTVPPLPPTSAAPAAAAAPVMSPLGPRLKRKATRSGDGVPYGQHGSWGLFREGVKEMTKKVADGVLNADEAAELLSKEGVSTSARMLARKATSAPGKSPVKAGVSTAIARHREEKIAEEIRFIRAHDLAFTKSMVKAAADSIIMDTPDADTFPNGVTDHWYYAFLDRWDMNTSDTKPLESDRDLWLTSTNAEKQYAVWAGIAVRNSLAVLNPTFDPTVPFSEMIIWKPEGLKRLISMDETDVRVDQTKRQKSMISVQCHAPGSRLGHKCAAPGPAATVDGVKKMKTGGFVPGVAEASKDNGAALSTKSAAKQSWCGGRVGNGQSLPPYIISDHPLDVAVLAAAPLGTAYDMTVNPPVRVPAAFNINKSGGMEKPDMVKYVDEIAVPATGVTPTNRGMFCMDGLGQHHCYEVVKKCDEVGLDIALRFPHGSSRGQAEDFVHFACFSPAFETAKRRAQVEQFQAMRAKVAAEVPARNPSRRELMESPILDDVAAVRAARVPWAEAFSEERVLSGWEKEGIVPFTRRLMWELRAEEAAKGITPSAVPPVDLAAYGISSPTAAVTTLAAVGGALIETPQEIDGQQGKWDAGIDEEVERLLRAELGDASLNVPPVAPPKKMPKLTSALLFKLPGGVHGVVGKQLVRSKEVERRLGIARKAYNEKKRTKKRAGKADAGWGLAATALDLLAANKFNLQCTELKRPHLAALVTSLQVGKGTGKKVELAQLLADRFGTITQAQFEQLKATVQRGAAVALLPPPSAAPLQLPQPPQPPPEQPLALSGPSGEAGRAGSGRPKRGKRR